MTSDPVDLNRFIIQQLEAQYRTIKLATDDLTDEQLYYQPTADANSIEWLMWHLSRWRDSLSAAMTGVSPVWVSDGWATRFRLSEVGTGLALIHRTAGSWCFRMTAALLGRPTLATLRNIRRRQRNTGRSDLTLGSHSRTIWDSSYPLMSAV